MNTLNRRDFLKFAGLVLASGIALPAHQKLEQGARVFADPQIRFGSCLLRGTAYGSILASSDEGSTWKEVVKLGEHHAILDLVEKNNQVYANLGLGAHDFWLRSADGQTWMTL